MKKLIVLSFVAAVTMSSGAQAAGLFARLPVLSPSIGISTGNINLLNGNVAAVGNGSSILSGIANGNTILNGIGLGNTTNSGVLSILKSSKKRGCGCY